MTDNSSEGARGAADLTVLSFRTLDEVKRLANHFSYVLGHPATQSRPAVHRYLTRLNETHRRIFTQKRESVEVEYIFTTEKKSNLQRQRFNSMQISEVPEMLKAELLSAERTAQVHICTDCGVEIELLDEEPLMESLQRHFSLEVHLPRPRRESVDVSEPVPLPHMSRRLSSMACGETHALDVSHLTATEELDRKTSLKLKTALVKHLPDNSEATIGAAVKFYSEVVSILTQDVAGLDFSAQAGSVAPIIMSIRDNVYNNFAADANKSIDDEDKPRSQTKKYRYYGPIESLILALLAEHRLLALVDDRTGKLAFFCIVCEYYTLRFHYDSVLSHVFSDQHVHNLAHTLRADAHVPRARGEPSAETVHKLNERFLLRHEVAARAGGDAWHCALCAADTDSREQTVLHILDEKHLARLSDELYAKARKREGGVPEDWGPKDLTWAKYLAASRPQHRPDHIAVENFIKPAGKAGSVCACCDMTLKGPRQVLFNHVRQKKHLRNAAPRKLAMLYAHHCRPAEYFASFGNFYVCSVCPGFVAMPAFAAAVDHFESDAHFDSIAQLIRSALYPDVDELLRAGTCPEDGRYHELLTLNRIVVDNIIRCEFCDETFPDVKLAVKHVLSSHEHQTSAADAKVQANRGDIISVYMKGAYILHSEGATFTCVHCQSVFNSIRSLLTHLVFADHFQVRPSAESVFRFYLELKHNITMLARNKYEYYEFGRLRCGVCGGDVEEGENAKRHVLSPRHRESMGATYVSVALDAPDGAE